jgi:hypothetical protein
MLMEKKTESAHSGMEASDKRVQSKKNKRTNNDKIVTDVY